MRLVFCGTPEFAVSTLESVIAAGHDVALVLAQPDRPAGRKAQMQAPPVRLAAERHGIPVAQPEKLKNNLELRARLEAIAPDAIIVVAYGRIIPKWMLDLPRHGNINLHGSLLPRWRGAAPIQWAIAAGDAVTGVTTMLLEEGLDTGPMLLRQQVPIEPDATAADLFTQLAPIGASLVVETLHGVESGTITPQRQDDRAATLAPILTRDDARIDWSQPARQIYDRFRGFHPWPGAWTLLQGKKLIVHAMRLSSTSAQSSSPGALFIANGVLHIATGDGVIEVTELQLEGKKRMALHEFLLGHPLHGGEVLGA